MVSGPNGIELTEPSSLFDTPLTKISYERNTFHTKFPRNNSYEAMKGTESSEVMKGTESPEVMNGTICRLKWRLEIIFVAVLRHFLRGILDRKFV